LAVVRLTAFLAGARFTAFRAVVRLAAFLAGARFAVFLARLTGMLYALLTAFLAGRFAAFLAGGRPAAFLADGLVAFLAGARFAAFLAGARPTTFFVARRAATGAAFRVETLVAALVGAFLAAVRPAVFLTPAFLVAARGDAAFLTPAEDDEDAFGAGSDAFPLRTSLSIALAANRTPRAGPMLTGAPVWGLRPIRAARRVGLKLPKPATTTRRPERTSCETT